LQKKREKKAQLALKKPDFLDARFGSEKSGFSSSLEVQKKKNKKPDFLEADFVRKSRALLAFVKCKKKENKKPSLQKKARLFGC